MLSNFFAEIFDRLPGTCFLCGAASRNGELCVGCHRDLPRLPAEACPRCALPTPRGQVCGACLRRPPSVDTSVAALAYAFPADVLIRQLKYSHRLDAAKILAGVTAERVATLDLCPDVLLPMPLHPARLSTRGFNQSIEIARIVARDLGWSSAPDLASRKRDTVPQVGLSPRERKRNLRDAFECSSDVRGLRIAILDDVITSGSSVNELARVLKRAGAAEVAAIAVARTVPGLR